MFTARYGLLRFVLKGLISFLATYLFTFIETSSVDKPLRCGEGPETHRILNFVVGCLGTESILLTVLKKGIFCIPVRKSGNGFANTCGDPERFLTSLVNICILSFWHSQFWRKLSRCVCISLKLTKKGSATFIIIPYFKMILYFSLRYKIKAIWGGVWLWV